MQDGITQCVGNSIIIPVGMQMTVGLRSSKYTFMIASMKIVPLFRLMLLILSFPYTSTVKSISVDVIAPYIQYIRVRGLLGRTWVRNVVPRTQRDSQSILNESFAVHFRGGQLNSEVYYWKAVNLHGF